MAKTLILLHNKDEIIKGIAGFRIGHYNFSKFPKERITIIRFNNIFNPNNNERILYWYIYIKRLIRKWKNKRLENIQRKKDTYVAQQLYYILDSNLVNYIIETFTKFKIYHIYCFIMLFYKLNKQLQPDQN